MVRQDAMLPIDAVLELVVSGSDRTIAGVSHGSTRPQSLRLKLLHHGGGVVVFQFLLVLPILLAVFAVAVQVVLIMQARAVVNYATFSAVRAAIVLIPARVTKSGGKTEAANELNANDASSPKMEL